MEYEERSDELKQEADRMEERSDGLEEDIEETSKDWDAKKSDPSVAGAQDAPGDEAEESAAEDDG